MSPLLQGQLRKEEKTMLSTPVVVLALVIGLLMESGCQSASAWKLLPAPTGVIAPAVQHNEEGILAYEQSQWAQARHHFEAAITAAPSLARSISTSERPCTN